MEFCLFLCFWYFNLLCDGDSFLVQPPALWRDEQFNLDSKLASSRILHSFVELKEAWLNIHLHFCLRVSDFREG